MASKKKNKSDYLDNEEMTLFRLTVRDPENEIYTAEQYGFGFDLNECKHDAKSGFLHAFPDHKILKIEVLKG